MSPIIMLLIVQGYIYLKSANIPNFKLIFHKRVNIYVKTFEFIIISSKICMLMSKLILKCSLFIV